MLCDNVSRVMDTLRQNSEPWGRAPRLIAVTKSVTVEQIKPLYDLGVRDIAENRVQALRERLPLLEGKFRAHMIGRLQTNKVKYIIDDVCMIHSLDRIELALEIDRQARKHALVMPVLVQVNIAREPQKGGIHPDETEAFVRACAQLPGLHVSGLMTILPLGAPRDLLLDQMTRMRALFEQTQAKRIPGADITELSMGMSQDYDIAARCGATMVRVGTALFA